MSFLSKLLQRAPAVQAPTAQEKEKKDLRKHPRVRMLKFHDVELKLTGGGVLEMSNLSVGGVGVFSDDPALLVRDRVLDLELRLGVQVFRLRARVTFTRDGGGGLEFQSPPMELALHIRKLFELELNSLKMTEIRAELLKQDPAGPTRCWMGDRNCEFLLVTSPAGELTRFQVSFFGNLVHGAPGRAPRVEQIADEDQRGSGAGYRGSTMVQRSDRSVRELMPELARFIEHIEGLEPALRSQVLAALAEN